MKAEKYEEFESILVTDDDKTKAIISNEKEIKDREKLAERLRLEGKSINYIRETLVTKGLTNTLEVKVQKLKNYFRDHHMSDEAQKVDKLTFKDSSQNFKKITNEIEFFGQSFLEGFLDFYGIELSNAVNDYEKRIHIIEQVDLNNNHKRYYLGTIENNNVKLANEDQPLASKQDAEQLKEELYNHKKEPELAEVLQRGKVSEDE